VTLFALRDGFIRNLYSEHRPTMELRGSSKRLISKLPNQDAPTKPASPITRALMYCLGMCSRFIAVYFPETKFIVVYTVCIGNS